MTVKELMEILSKYDPEKQVGGSGWFGELLEIWDVRERKEFVEISIEPPGEEPN